MKATVNFQLLILWITAPVLLALSAVWSWFVFDSVSAVITKSFDRKLLGMSGSLAALIDADSHQAYQTPKRFAVLGEGAPGQLLGFNAENACFYEIDPRNGAASMLFPWNSGAPSSIAYLPEKRQLAALTHFGRTLLLRDIDSGAIIATRALSQRVDGLFRDGKKLRGWNGTRPLEIDVEKGSCSQADFDLPDVPRAFSAPEGKETLYLLCRDGKTLLRTDRAGKELGRLQLKVAEAGERLSTPEIQDIAADGEHLYTAGVSLLEIDPATGDLKGDGRSYGYFSEDDPFFQRYRQILIDTCKAAQLTFFYTYVYQGDDRIYYVLDGTVGDSHSIPGAPDKLPNAKSIEGAQKVQFLKRPWTSELQKWDQWGLIKSSSYPIINNEGKTVAVAAADVNVTVITEKTRWSLFAALFIGGIFLVFASFVSYKVAHNLIRPLRKLKESALRIAAGNYTGQVDNWSNRETAPLARTLGLLGLRLAEQQSRSRSYQESLHQRRRHITLARALEEYTAKQTIASQALTSLSKSANGSCWRGLDGVFWHSGNLDEEVSAACLKARLTVLGRQLLGAGLKPEDVPATMLDCAPALKACARWHTAGRRLYFATRQPCWLWIGTRLQQVNGIGSIGLESEEPFEWSDEGPEGFEVEGEKKEIDA